mmetsp:Transcript_108735/g.318119  ORF Transcript_108735/g.318119 Transcript_108735/m.318119 type:complete len:230 (-) Transcript_108735:32-721(-)
MAESCPASQQPATAAALSASAVPDLTDILDEVSETLLLSSVPSSPMASSREAASLRLQSRAASCEAWLMISTPSTKSTTATIDKALSFIGFLGGEGPMLPQRKATTMAEHPQVADATARPARGIAMNEKRVAKTKSAPASAPNQLHPTTMPPDSKAGCSSTEAKEESRAPNVSAVLKTIGSGACLHNFPKMLKVPLKNAESAARARPTASGPLPAAMAVARLMDPTDSP